jgi:chaperonin GroES
MAKKPKIRPLGEKILVKRLEAEQMTKGGIVLPDTAKEKPKEGKVIAVGDGRMLADGQRAEFQVSTGDQVLFSSYAGTEIKFEGEEYLLMDESDVLAIVG